MYPATMYRVVPVGDPTPRDALAGQVAVVTGASRGIGRAIAAGLLAAGARVVLTARSPEGLELARAELDPGGAGRVVVSPGRADDPAHQQVTVALALERFGRLDLLVNNAGINPAYGRLVDADLGAVRKILEVNLVAGLAWVQHAWRDWMSEHGGAVLNVASVAGLTPATGIGAYGVSKAGLIHLTRQLAAELAPGVRVNAVAPAVVTTDFARALYEGREEQVAAGYPLGRLGRPEDVARLAVFLLGPAAGWITGQTIVVDGGLGVATVLG